MDGYHVPDHRYANGRVGCIKDCEIDGCKQCYDGFTAYCRACEQDYSLTNDGYCYDLADTNCKACKRGFTRTEDGHCRKQIPGEGDD